MVLVSSDEVSIVKVNPLKVVRCLEELVGLMVKVTVEREH